VRILKAYSLLFFLAFLAVNVNAFFWQQPQPDVFIINRSEDANVDYSEIWSAIDGNKTLVASCDLNGDCTFIGDLNITQGKQASVWDLNVANDLNVLGDANVLNTTGLSGPVFVTGDTIFKRPEAGEVDNFVIIEDTSNIGAGLVIAGSIPLHMYSRN